MHIMQLPGHFTAVITLAALWSIFAPSPVRALATGQSTDALAGHRACTAVASAALPAPREGQHFPARVRAGFGVNAAGGSRGRPAGNPCRATGADKHRPHSSAERCHRSPLTAHRFTCAA